MDRNLFMDMCGSKVRHPTRESAAKSARQLRAAGAKGKIGAYGCPFSAPGDSHFHVGHDSPARAKRRNKRVLNRYAAAPAGDA